MLRLQPNKHQKTVPIHPPVTFTGPWLRSINHVEQVLVRFFGEFVRGWICEVRLDMFFGGAEVMKNSIGT